MCRMPIAQPCLPCVPPWHCARTSPCHGLPCHCVHKPHGSAPPHSPHRCVHHAGPHPPPHRRVRDPQLERFYKAMRPAPSLHVIGDRDPVKPLTNLVGAPSPPPASLARPCASLQHCVPAAGGAGEPLACFVGNAPAPSWLPGCPSGLCRHALPGTRARGGVALPCYISMICSQSALAPWQQWPGCGGSLKCGPRFVATVCCPNQCAPPSDRSSHISTIPPFCVRLVAADREFRPPRGGDARARARHTRATPRGPAARACLFAGAAAGSAPVTRGGTLRRRGSALGLALKPLLSGCAACQGVSSVCHAARLSDDLEILLHICL